MSFDDLDDMLKVLFTALVFVVGLFAGSMMPRSPQPVATGDIRGPITNCASAACDGVCISLPSTCSMTCVPEVPRE